MRLLLLNPFFSGAVKIPLFSLGFIGSYVRQNSGCAVEVIDQNLEDVTDEQILNKMKDTDILGLTCFTESRFEVFNFAARAKQANPCCMIIVGGPHVQTLDKEVLAHYPFVDIVVRGEGEETVLDLVNKKPLKEISGITWRCNDKVVRNQARMMASDIACFSFDYSLINAQIRGWKDYEIPYSLLNLNALPVIASRGCPFKCRFCAANRQWETSYRFLSPDDLVRKIEYYTKEYNIGYFRFYDALFVGNETRLLAFCDLLEKSGISISFRIDVRVGTSYKVLKRLREVGCDVLGFGIESGSDKVLKRIKKGITRKQAEETIRITRELGFWIIGFFMISLPDEDIEDITSTFELLDLFDEANVQFFKIHPNTEFYEELILKGEIDNEIWFDPARGKEIFYCKEQFPSAHLGINEVNGLLTYAYSRIIMANPKRWIRTHGIVKGPLLVMLSAMASVLLKRRRNRLMYQKLKNNYLIQTFYTWLKK